MSDRGMDARHLGHHLATARTLRHMTQQELAAQCTLQQSDISKFEQGQRWPSIPQLLKLAQALELPLQWFVTGSPRPGFDLRAVALELYHLGIVDLRVANAHVPGAFRPPEEILAWLLSEDRPDPRIVEAIPAVFAWNVWNPLLLEAYGKTKAPRVAPRLAWLADVALTLRHNRTFPGGFRDPMGLSAFVRRIQPADEPDDLGYPAPSRRLLPVSKRWNIGYAADLNVFYERAKHLHSLRREADGGENPSYLETIPQIQ